MRHPEIAGTRNGLEIDPAAMRLRKLCKLLGRKASEQHPHTGLFRLIENLNEMHQRFAGAEDRLVESQPLDTLQIETNVSADGQWVWNAETRCRRDTVR